MIDHIKLHVADAERSKAFYEQALAPLASASSWSPFRRRRRHGRAFRTSGSSGRRADRRPRRLRADDRAAVDAFHAAALAAGGRDNGGPGLRPQYHPGYYGAFAFDPDGNNVEAVHHTFDA